MNGLSFQGAEKQRSSAKHHKSSKSVSILAFNDIMDNSLARSFFLAFLEKHNVGNLLKFWIDIEKLRLQKQRHLQPSAEKIFQVSNSKVSFNMMDLTLFVELHTEFDTI